MIFEAKLSPKAGYAEVEVNGERTYRNIETGVLIEDEIPTSTPGERITALESATGKAIADSDAMNVDQEYRLTLLELGLNE